MRNSNTHHQVDRGITIEANHLLSKEDGFTLLGVMIAALVLGTMIVVYSNLFSNNLDSTKKLETRNEIEDLRKYVRVGMSAKNTKTNLPVTCDSSTYIALKKQLATAGDLIVTSNSSGDPRTKIGNYYLYSMCTDTANQIQVFYSKDSSGSGSLLYPAPIVLQ